MTSSEQVEAFRKRLKEALPDCEFVAWPESLDVRKGGYAVGISHAQIAEQFPIEKWALELRYAFKQAGIT